MNDHDPLDELARLRLEMDPATRTDHLEAVDDALRRRHPVPPSRARRWTLGVVVGMLVAGPLSAVASDRAVPGDLLYSLKQALEPIMALVDRDVVAEHRVEEVDELVRRGGETAVIESHVAVARDALAATDAPSLERELDRIVDSWSRDRRSTDVGRTDDVVPVTTTPPDTLQREPDDRRRTDAPTTVTTTSPGDAPVDGEEPPPERTTTTTSVPSGDDRPPPQDGEPLQDRP
ncbi:MAG TPA: hypothetical protein VIW46_11500 [Acidimicrobiia bacterium]